MDELENVVEYTVCRPLNVAGAHKLGKVMQKKTIGTKVKCLKFKYHSRSTPTATGQR